MEVKAHLKDLRMSPRKVKIVCDKLRGKHVGDAVAILMNTRKKDWRQSIVSSLSLMLFLTL